MKATNALSPILVLTLSVLFIGCSSSNTDEKTESQESTNFNLVKVDSFQVDNFTRVVIRDFSPEENIYLGYSIIEDDILEISPSGEILKRVNRKGEGPELYGTWNPIGLGFGPDSLRIVELPLMLAAYNPDYEMEYSHRIQSPLPIRTNMPLGTPPYYQKNDTTFLLVGPSNYLTANYLIINQEGKDTLQNFYQLNLQTGDVKSVVPYDENSIYTKSQGIFPELMGKTFFIDRSKNELVLVQNLDPEILVYDLDGLTLKNRIPVSYSEFLRYDPVSIETSPADESTLPSKRLAAKNQKLVNLGNGIYLLQYFTGITEAEFEARNSEDDPYNGQFDTEEQRLIVFKNGTQVGSELPAIKGNIILTLPNQKILVQEPENSEIEEEFTRFSIYELQNE